MRRPALEVYALAVCFVTLVCAAVAVGIGIWDVVQISAPSFTLNAWQYDRHQSDEAFARFHEQQRGSKEELAPEEIPARRQESYQALLRSQRRDGVQSLVMVLIVLLVDAVLFATHWRLARRIAAGG